MKELSVGQKLVRQTESVFREFVYFPHEHAYTVASLWVPHAALRDTSGRFLPFATPRLPFVSDVPGCGKSVAAELTIRMSVAGEIIGNPTTPGFTMLTHQGCATVCLDEMDILFGPRGNKREELKGLLNLGYRRGATTGRERNGALERLNVHAPVVLAGKNAERWLTDAASFGALRSRSITVVMTPIPDDVEEPTEFEPEIHGWRLEQIRDRWKFWGRKFAVEVCSEDVDDLIRAAGLRGRDREIWRILFRVAQHVGGEWPARCTAAALAFVRNEWGADELAELMSAEDRLLSAVRGVFRSGEEFLPTTAVLARLGALPEAPAVMAGAEGEKASQMRLSTTLRDCFDIQKAKRSHGGRQVWGYDRQAVFGSSEAPVDVEEATTASVSQLSNLSNQPTFVEESA